VRFTLTGEDLAYYNVMLHRWIAESGRYDVLIAASSRTSRLSGPSCMTIPAATPSAKMQEDRIG
jgi:hypothetical protein